MNRTEIFRQKRTDKITGRHECVLIVIDVQDKLMPVITGRENVQANISRLLKVCHLAGIPVIVTEQEKLGSTIDELIEDVPIEAIITKVHFNCFSNEVFSEYVSKTGRKTLILAGVEAHICVCQTALHAIPFYNVQVVSDAVSSRHPDNRHIALQRVRDAGAVITSTEMFIYEILEKGGTDEFRAALPLIK